jgi:hypothetical protein
MKGLGLLPAAAVACVAVLHASAAWAENGPKPPKVSIGGYVESDFSYNFNDPSNGVTNFRGFDNRHNTFTLSNAVLDTQWEASGVDGRVSLQAGHTPSTYYLAEPSRPGASGAGSTGAEVFKYIQRARVGYTFPVAQGLHLQMGIFLSPVGIESLAVKDSWNWSRSNLFFGLPFYHTGIRATQQVGSLALTFGVINGWNSVVDNNDDKSIYSQIISESDRLRWAAVYVGGNERNLSVPEGRTYRHLLDASVLVKVNSMLSVAANADVGAERNRFGWSSWYAGALYGRVQLVPDTLFVAVRQDYFRETTAQNASGTASTVFFLAKYVASSTATIEGRAREALSVRLEYRHDLADASMFFAGQVQGDGVTNPQVPNAKTQDTLTLGATAWF